MKKYFVFFAAAVMMIGCAKEQIDNNEPAENPVEGTIVSFTAELPDFTDPETKATVNSSSFTWKAGDQIAIPVKDGEGVRYVNFTNSAGALNTFTYSVTTEEFVAGTAYYPASSAPGGSYSTSFSSVAAAQEGFKMTAPVALGATSLTFTHQSSLINLQFTNVPSFANKLVVNDGSDDVAVINFTSPTSSMSFDVPVTPAGSKTYTFKLQENSNVLKQVSKTTSLAAGTYYTTPSIAVRYMMLGVVTYIYNGWGLTTGWKMHHWGSSLGDQDVVMKSLGTTSEQSVGSSYWSGDAQTFYMFYTVEVPSDIDGFCIFWTNGSETDWYNAGGDGNGNSSQTSAYVFEYSSTKHTFYK